MSSVSKYNEEHCHLAEEIYALGGTGKQVCNALNIGHKTLYNWKRDHPEFKNAILRGKDRYNMETVENALLKRALGCKVTNKKTKRVYLKGKAPDGAKVDVPAEEVVTDTKEYAPDTTAIIFYLVNRYRNEDDPRWVNLRQVQEHTGSIEHKHEHERKDARRIVEQLTSNELQELGKLLFKSSDTDAKRVEEGDVLQEPQKVRDVQLEDS